MTSLQNILEKTARAINAREFDVAVSYAHRAVSIDPFNSTGYYYLGLALERLSRLDESELALQRCVELDPAIAALDLLSAVQLRLRHFHKLELTLETVIRRRPQRTDAYLDLAKYRLHSQGPKAALDVLSRAQAEIPSNVKVNLAIINLEASGRNDSELNELRRFMDDNPLSKKDRLYVALRIAEVAARHNRQLAMLSIESATSWLDGCMYNARHELSHVESIAASILDDYDTDIDALKALTICAIGNMNWPDADFYSRRAQRVQNGLVTDVVLFDQALLSEIFSINELDIEKSLAPVQNVTEPISITGPSLFLASDPDYCERFTLPFLKDLAKLSPKVHAHVHLLDGDDSHWQTIHDSIRAIPNLNVSISAEASNARKSYGARASYYYHAIRYIRFYQYIHWSRKPAWILDVDLKLNRDLLNDLNELNSFDVAIYCNPINLEPWGKIYGAMVGVAPTPHGFAYAHHVAAYITHWFKQDMLRWGIDQAALFCTYAWLTNSGQQPRTLFLDNHSLSLCESETSAVTFSHGVGKFFLK